MSRSREERAGADATVRRFYLGVTPDEGEPRLTPEDARHAATVLRLRTGDRILGLDGRGRAWPLSIEGVERGAVAVAVRGEAQTEPRPGAPDAPVPDLRVAFSMPQTNRLEALVDRLTQIGVARIAPFVAAHTPVRSRTLGARGIERVERIVRAACKQSRRLWEPTLEPVRPLAELLAADENSRVAVLDPAARAGLADWIGRCRTDGVRALTLVVGPEGGFSAEETAAFEQVPAAVERLRLAPYVLRIETAAEVAAGIAVHGFV